LHAAVAPLSFARAFARRIALALDIVALDTSAQRKARGAFFTPAEIVSFISKWAVRSRGDAVFEPSCGEAAFLMGAGDRLRELGATRAMLSSQLGGVELHVPSAAAAGKRLAEHGLTATIATGDFVDQDPRAAFDAVVGNPPYVRDQRFLAQHGRKDSKRLGVTAFG
jgi:type I restriction-modification system DNA methylase subunit